MPSRYTKQLPSPYVVEPPTASERFTHALVALTRTVWHPGCTFDSAMGSICEAAPGQADRQAYANCTADQFAVGIASACGQHLFRAPAPFRPSG